jgi:hypothetical protein
MRVPKSAKTLPLPRTTSSLSDFVLDVPIYPPQIRQRLVAFGLGTAE